MQYASLYISAGHATTRSINYEQFLLKPSAKSSLKAIKKEPNNSEPFIDGNSKQTTLDATKLNC